MHIESHVERRPTWWIRVLAVIAIVFGIATLVSGGGVLFGPHDARAAAGNYVGFVVWFNFIAGFAYIVAGLGIWRAAGWAGALAILIFGATVLVGLAFGVHVFMGKAFEMRTVGALILRAAVWAAIAALLVRKGAQRDAWNR